MEKAVTAVIEADIQRVGMEEPNRIMPEQRSKRKGMVRRERHLCADLLPGGPEIAGRREQQPEGRGKRGLCGVAHRGASKAETTEANAVVAVLRAEGVECEIRSSITAELLRALVRSMSDHA